MFVKAIFKNQKRKFKVDEKATFGRIMSELVRCFGEEVKQHEVGYVDSECEFIGITNDADWEVCVEEYRLLNGHKAVQTIEIVVNADEADCLPEDKKDVSVEFKTLGQSTSEDLECSGWRVIDPILSKQTEEPQMNESRTEEPKTEEPKTEEPKEETPKEAPAQPVFKNTGSDICVDMTLKGTPEELEEAKRRIIEQYVSQGFEVETAEISKPEQDIEEMDSECRTESNMSQVSRVSAELKEEVESMIDAKLAHYLSKMNMVTEDISRDPKVHHGTITCDGCNKNIQGMARFKSCTKFDYDLCEDCEATGMHPEPMIKFRAAAPREMNWKMNSNFGQLKALVSAENAPQEPPRKAHWPCHIRRSQPESSIETAQQTLKNAAQKVAEVVKEAVKARAEPQETTEKREAVRNRLCHIRRAPENKEQK